MLSSCRNQEVSHLLACAEECMISAPDSSLNILERIDPATLTNMADKALYSLLYAQARDKNYIDDSDDSLINVAVSYYMAKKDKYRLFLSYYYQGRIRENAGLDVGAMLSYVKAEEMVPEVNDCHYQVGLLYAHIGLIHQNLYNFNRAIDYFQLAYERYLLAGNEFLAMSAQCNLAQAYFYSLQTERAEQLFSELLEWSYINRDVGLCSDSFTFLALIYDRNKDDEKLTNHFRSKYYQFCGSNITTLRILAYHYAKSNGKYSKLYMDAAWSLSNSLNDTIALEFQEFRIAKSQHNYESAIAYLERVYKIQDSLVRNSLEQPHIEIQRNYYQEKYKNTTLLLENRNLQIFILIVVLLMLVIIAVLISFVVRTRFRERAMQIDEYIAKIDDLKDAIFIGDKKIMDMTSELREMGSMINELYSSEYKLIDKLCKTYYETHGVRKDRDAIYKQVKTEIEKLASDKNCIIQVEEYVNKYRGNIMALLRQELPMFSPMDYRFLCFFYAGFSAKAISVFTNDSINNIYVRKYRYRDRILKAGTKHCKMFLENLL